MPPYRASIRGQVGGKPSIPCASPGSIVAPTHHATRELAMSWTTPTVNRLDEAATCCFCGRRAPRGTDVMRSAGWQVRNDYPVRFRCRRCRQRQDREAA